MNGLNHINHLSPIAIGGPGNKLAKQAVEEGDLQVIKTTAPIAIGGGSFVYKDGELQYLLNSEGRVVFNPDGTHEYKYFLKDHLGNTRVTFGEDGIIQEDSYYPFGMLERSGNPAIAGTMAGLSHQTGEDLPNKYLYNAEKPKISDFIVFRASLPRLRECLCNGKAGSKNHRKQSFFIFRDGKELQDDYNLDWYDYGTRFYDPVLGRFHCIDTWAEKCNFQSPYLYAYNNPVRFTDYFGLGGEDKVTTTHKVDSREYDNENQTVTITETTTTIDEEANEVSCTSKTVTLDYKKVTTKDSKGNIKGMELVPVDYKEEHNNSAPMGEEALFALGVIGSNWDGTGTYRSIVNSGVDYAKLTDYLTIGMSLLNNDSYNDVGNIAKVMTKTQGGNGKTKAMNILKNQQRKVDSLNSIINDK